MIISSYGRTNTRAMAIFCASPPDRLTPFSSSSRVSGVSNPFSSVASRSVKDAESNAFRTAASLSGDAS